MTTTPDAEPDAASRRDDTGALESAVAMMARIRTCWSPSFSPDGKTLAFVSDLNGVPQVWTVPVEGGWPTLVTPLDDQIMRVEWSTNGEWLAFGLAPGGGLNEQVYLVRPDGTGLCRLTEGGKDNNWLGRWTHDGRALDISSSRRDPAAMDSYLVDAESGDWRLVAENQGIGQVTGVSRDGRKAVLYRMVSRSDDNLYLVDVESRHETLLTPHEGPGSFDFGTFSPDGSAIYLSSNAGRELRAFARVRLDDRGGPGPVEVIAGRDDAELENFKITEDGTAAVLLWNAAGRTELALLDLATMRMAPGPDLPGEVVLGLDLSKDGRYVALAVAGAATPTNIWALDRQSGRLWQVTKGAHAGVDLGQLVRPELVRFQAHDGLDLSGWLYLPRGYSRPGPMVLSFHGGPEAQERPWFSSTYQALLSQGIAVLAPNVRGSDGFGKTFVNLDNGALRFDAVRDIRACVDYVVAAGLSSPKRIGIMGGSYGGYMTMAGLAEYPELFGAGACICGIVNFETFFAQTEPWMAAISKVEYGDPDTEAELLRELSPIHKIDRIISPTIVLHGANDTNVPVVEADQVVNSLRERRVPVEYVLFSDEGHGFRKTPNRIRAAVETVRWFAQHL